MRAPGGRLAEHWITIGSPILLLAAWELASATGLLREAFFPRPSTIVMHLRQLAADGTLWGHTAMTLVRIGCAFALAAVLGVGVGLAMGLWRRLRDGLDPVFAVIYRGRGGAADLNIRGGPALDRRIVAERTADQRTFALARKVLRRGEPALEPVLTSTDQVVNDHLSVLPAA